MPQAQGVIDYRRTFLRHHVRRELRRTDDVLALEELKSRIEDAGAAPDDQRTAQFLNLAEFFYRDKPDERLYIPIRIYNATRPSESYDDLANLLERTREQPFGILIQACSGAGKTVGCLKAFCDCLPHKRVVGGQTQEIAPRLTGYVPCWIRFEGQLPEDPRRIVNELIKRAAGRDGDQAQLAASLKHGPPLLLFFDLNTADSCTREAVAEGLVAFQQEYLPRGHRCIVTYRSTNDADPVLQVLRESKDTPFRPFDLRTVPMFQARAYLRNIRRFEQEIRRALGLAKLKEDSIDRTCNRLDDFVKRHVRGSDSLISTPLLTHFISMLDEKELRKVRTIWDLYYRVVEKHLEREQRYTRSMPRLMKDQRVRREASLAVMVALAWAILSRGAQNVRLDVRSVEALLRDPKSDLAGFWPKGEVWDRSLYINRGAGSPLLDDSGARDVVGGLLEFSLLRRDSDGIGFLHDSLIYYFFAFGARYCHGPDQPSNASSLPERWHAQVADHASLQPEVWDHPAEFLGGALVEYAAAGDQAVSALALERESQGTCVRATADYSAIQGLAEQLILAEPNVGLPTILSRLLRGCVSKNDPICHDLSRALGWHGSLVQQDPRLLAQECYNYLYWQDYWRESATKPCLHFAEELLIKLRRQARDQLTQRRKVRSWLRQQYGPPPGVVQTMAEHTGVVEAVVTLSGRRIVSGSQDGTVKLWDPATGEVKTMDEHACEVTCIAILDGGRIVSSDGDTVKLWDPGTGEVRTMDKHTKEVMCVAALDDGRIVSASGTWSIASAGGTWPWCCSEVKLWDPATNAVHTITEHAGVVQSVAVLESTRIVSANHEGTLKCWDAATGELTILTEEAGWVRSLAVVNGGRIAWGTQCGSVLVLDSRTGEVYGVHPHIYGPVMSIVVVEETGIVSAGDDGLVNLWDPATGNVRTMDRHIGFCVNSVAALDDGRIVSGGVDGTVNLWDPMSGVVKTMHEHNGWVTSVAVLDDGRVVSGSSDSTVKLWDSAVEQQEFSPESTSEVCSMVFCDDGRVVSGGNDGEVKLWDPSTGENSTIVEHATEVCALAVVEHGWVVSGSADGTVKVWDPAKGDVKTMGAHGDRVTSVAALKNARFVSGGKDGNVDIWQPSASAVTTMEVEDDMVESVATFLDGRIVTGQLSGTVKLWDLESADVKTMHEHTLEVNSLAILDDGRIVSGCLDKTVKLWDPVSHEVKTKYYPEEVMSLAVLENGWIVVGIRSGAISLWNPANSDEKTMDDHFGPLSSMTVLHDGRIVSGSKDCTVRVWDHVSDVVVPFAVTAEVKCLAAHRELPRIAVGVGRGQIYILDLEPDIAYHRLSAE